MEIPSAPQLDTHGPQLTLGEYKVSRKTLSFPRMVMCLCGYLRVVNWRPSKVFAASSEAPETGNQALRGDCGASGWHKYNRVFTLFFLQNHSGNDS